MNEYISFPAKTVTVLNDSALAGAFVIQNRGTAPVVILATATDVAPTEDLDAGLLLTPGQPISATQMADIFPSLAGGAYLWAYSTVEGAVWINTI